MDQRNVRMKSDGYFDPLGRLSSKLTTSMLIASGGVRPSYGAGKEGDVRNFNLFGCVFQFLNQFQRSYPRGASKTVPHNHCNPG
jgi:hypothetical protein